MSRRVDLEITRLGARGDGIGNLDGAPVYVPFTLPGEKVTAVVSADRAGTLRAEKVEIITPAAARQAPVCRHFGVCGGCAAQHMTPLSARAWKRQVIIGALARKGLAGEAVAEVAGLPSGGRRRATFSAWRTAGRAAIGFMGRASHRPVAIDRCPVLEPALEALLPALVGLCGQLLENGERGSLGLCRADNGVDLVIGHRRSPRLADLRFLADFATQHDIARISWCRNKGTPEIIVARMAPMVRCGTVDVALPPGAFLQASRAGQDALSMIVTDAARDARKVLDLFSGIGTFSFPLAGTAAVTAVDSSTESIGAISAAARTHSGIKAVEASVRDLFASPYPLADNDYYDTVIFDPPRAGARRQAVEIGRSRVRTVIAVSCNPSTLARDLRILVDAHYDIETIIPVDQFGHAAHIEAVAVLRKSTL